MQKADVTFDGSIPDRYDRFMGPALFDPYARDLAARLADEASRVLELACGTGIVTRQLRSRLADDAELVATDLADAMVQYARAHTPAGGIGASVEFRQADAQALPFENGAFDTVVCQFGVMFFPDKTLAFREAHRVLAKGGSFLFSVWDSLDANFATHTAAGAIRKLFPVDPPLFYDIPFGYHDDALIRPPLAAAGFTGIVREVVPMTMHSHSAREIATGLVTGSPMVTAIRERGTILPEAVVDAVTAALESALGKGAIAAPMQAVVYSARA